MISFLFSASVTCIINVGKIEYVEKREALNLPLAFKFLDNVTKKFKIITVKYSNLPVVRKDDFIKSDEIGLKRYMSKYINMLRWIFK